MRGLIEVLRGIVAHPLNRNRPFAAIARFAAWQVRTRLARTPIEVPFVDGTRLLVRRGMTGATGNVYCGLHELREMGLVLHALRPGDLFVDVGANVGSYTLLAAGVCGADAIAVEPVPSTAESLRANVAANEIGDRVQCVEQAIGAQVGIVRMTTGNDAMNRIADADAAGDVVEVPMTTIDSLLSARVPTCIKLDVEGHERDALLGASLALASPGLRLAIVEMWEAGRDDIERMMRAAGFVRYTYDPFARTLTPEHDSSRGANAIFVRDVDWLAERVSSAPARLLHPVGRLI